MVVVTEIRERPLGVTILAVLNIIGGILTLILGLTITVFIAFLGFLLPTTLPFRWLVSMLGIVVGILLVLMGVLGILVGLGFWRGWGWSWTLSVFLYGISFLLSLVNIIFARDLSSVIGLIINGILLYYLFRPHVKAWFGKI